MTSYHSHPPKAYRRFESVCTQAPNAIAVVHEGKPVTYQQLQTQVLERSERLIRQGLADHPYMPLMANRCLEYLITMLACCKLGITYVSIEPSKPSKRLIAVLEQLGCNHLLLLGQPTDLRPDPTLTSFAWTTARLCAPTALPYASLSDGVWMMLRVTVMFTSGTTGVPKGVRISQDGLLILVDNVQQQVHSKPRSYVHHSSIGFDAALFEVWVPLLTGACVTLQPSEFNIDALDHCRTAASCDVLLLTTSLFHLVAQHRLSMLEAVPCSMSAVKYLNRCCPPLLLANPRITLVNGYGPTENTVFSTWYSLNKPEDAERDVIPIGQFLHQVHGKIVDAKLQEVEVGTPGELLLTGANLALGYLDEALTPTRFYNCRNAYYRTGDYVIQDEHGMLFYQGRIDEQVKIKGFRVEIAEVEHALTQLPGVATCGAGACHERFGNSLHGFIVFHRVPAWLANYRRKQAHEPIGHRLPHYMVPRRIHYLAELPVTANGKVDKRSLQPPEKAAVVSPQAGSAVLEIWSGILGTRNLQLEHSIYGYGASSLSVVMAHSRINEILGRTTLSTKSPG
uniref:Amino acid-adenylating enzyme n=1 Tax=Pseudomonas syringae TaxID=317 RepID=Q52379_PSESX|nr:amino acid-adenylating enzyme [Pseudomonas syringae]